MWKQPRTQYSSRHGLTPLVQQLTALYLFYVFALLS